MVLLSINVEPGRSCSKNFCHCLRDPASAPYCVEICSEIAVDLTGASKMSTGVVMSEMAIARGRPVTSDTSISRQYSECQVRALRILSVMLIALSATLR